MRPNNTKQLARDGDLKEQAYNTLMQAVRLIAVGFDERRAELLRRVDEIIRGVYDATK